MPPSDLKARELLFGNINPEATINVHCRSTSGRIADEFRSRGFARVQAFPEIGFEGVGGMKRDDYADIPPSDFEIRSMFEGDDALGVILKGHLYVEHFSLVLSRVPALKADAAFRLSFAQKIDPAVEAGIIPADEKRTFVLINQIRNRFAHQPRSYFSEDDADAIWKALSPRMIDSFTIAGRPGPEYFDLPLDLFKCCIIVIC